MSSIGGQRSRTARANFSPSIEPGMSMSVKTMRMSFRASKMAMASSAFDAYRSVSCRLHQIDGMQPTKELVLNYENVRW